MFGRFWYNVANLERILGGAFVQNTDRPTEGPKDFIFMR